MRLLSMLLGSDDLVNGPDADSDFWYMNRGGGYQGLGSNTHAGKRVSPEIAMQISTVYACVNLITKSIASLPLQVWVRQPRVGKPGQFDRYLDPTNPLSDLLQYQPNAWQTAFDFKAMMQMNLLLRGNAYAEIKSGVRGAVDQLRPIHPDLVSVERLPDDTLRYTVTDVNGQTRKILQEDMLHIRSNIAPNGMEGMTPIAYARETVGLNLAMEEYGARMFEQGVRPSGAIKLASKLNKDQHERFRKQFNQGYSGLGNSHKVMILEEGAEFQPISFKADELQYLSSREFGIEEVARWFDVPLVLLHSHTKTTSWGTGVESIMSGFVRNCLRPWLDAWEQAVRRDLIIAPFKYYAEFDTSALQRGDTNAVANFYEKLTTAKIITPNEARAALGYNSIDGGDVMVTKPGDIPQGGEPVPADQSASRDALVSEAFDV